jgi:hypothetical protein
MTSIMPIDGNEQFHSVVNTDLSGSNLLNGLKEVDPVAGIFTSPNVTGGKALGILTHDDLVEAYTGGALGFGLQMDNVGGAYSFLAAAADTNAAAAAIQADLGLLEVGDSRLLKFYWLDAPVTTNVTLTPLAGTKVVVKTVNSGAAGVISTIVAGATAPTNFQALVMVTATNVTAGAETVLVNILKSAAYQSV